MRFEGTETSVIPQRHRGHRVGTGRSGLSGGAGFPGEAGPLRDMGFPGDSSSGGEPASRALSLRDLNGLAERVIGAAITVHRALGPGLLESAYRACLATELKYLGIPFQREVAVPLLYRGAQLDCSYRLDFLVDGRVVVEVKPVAGIDPVFIARTLTDLKLTRHPLALLINFNVPILKQGIKRLVLT